MPGRTFAENEQIWRETLSDQKKSSALTRGTLRIMGIFFAVITRPLVALAALGIRGWDTVGWMLVFDGIALACIYGFFGLYMPFMYRVGQRWAAKRGGVRPGHPIHRRR